MAIPGDPSVQDVVLQGLKEGGQYTATAGSSAYTEFVNYQWATVKAEIWNACRTDKLIETESVLLCPIGNSAVSLPSDFDSEISLAVYDADDSFRGTAQAGGASTITLASTFSATAEDMYGRYIFTLSGTGAGQVRQVTGYDNSTKVVTVHTAWATQPDSTTTYLVSVIRYPLKRRDYYRSEIPNQRPSWYSMTGTSLLVTPAADKIYPILLTYRPNLTRLDEAGSVFVKHMRERRHLWVQGVKVKTMARYDDDRYGTEKQIWEQMLRQYGAQNVVYTQMAGHR